MMQCEEAAGFRRLPVLGERVQTKAFGASGSGPHAHPYVPHRIDRREGHQENVKGKGGAVRQINPSLGERWLTLVFQFEPELRAELARALRGRRDGSVPSEDLKDVGSPVEGTANAVAQRLIDEQLLDTYARILTAASDETFMPPCLRTFALGVAREVAGLPPEASSATLPDYLTPLLRIVSTLPALTRRVFTLRKVYEYSADEIATRLGLSAEEVDAHLIQAAQACSRHLGVATSKSRPPEGPNTRWWRRASQRFPPVLRPRR